ncbi:MAG: aldo/keto reductase [Desulfobacterales bacterium]|jgi:aryl-alcohol dehydrogenase-like predicted oxidoreductase|nr:aldo/keto reductase [Desulfobacterales bacterium]
MNYVDLGTTGLQVSQLCLGTMTFGKEADRQTSAAIYRRCREAGINFLDCANVYAQGESERILGELIAKDRGELILTSKVGGAMGAGANRSGLSRRHILKACEESLRRLGTDWIDVYFAHHCDSRVPVEESLRAFDALVQQGKVRYLGVSNWAAWKIARALGISALHGVSAFRVMQPMYSIVKRQAEVELLPLALAAGMGVITYSPLGGGLLTGKYGSAPAPGAGRLAENQMYTRRYADGWMFEAAQGLKRIAAETGHSPASLAVAWAARHPAVTCPIIGARSLEQLEPALAAADIELPPDLYARLCALAPAPPPATDRTEERG